jgi:RNA-splicing ligase RtcB
MSGAQPANVSERARERQRREMGTLGSGNHYLEVQAVAEIFDAKVADVFELSPDDVVATIHCGSRGLGHQIGTEFLKEMLLAGKASGIELIDRELACAPINSDVGERYLGAMRAAINCALANREILGHYARRVFSHFFSACHLRLLFDVSHNTCKSKRTSSRERIANSSFTAREPPGPLDLATKAYPSRYARSVSRCSSAAVWGLDLTYWLGKPQPKARHFPRRVTAPDGRCPDMPR